MSLRTPILTTVSAARDADAPHNSMAIERASMPAGPKAEAHVELSVRMKLPAHPMKSLLSLRIFDPRAGMNDAPPSDIRLRDIRGAFRYSPLVQPRRNDPRCGHAPSRSSGPPRWRQNGSFVRLKGS